MLQFIAPLLMICAAAAAAPPSAAPWTTLEDAVAAALVHNERSISGQIQVDRADAAVQRHLGAFMPRATVRGDAGVGRRSFVPAGQPNHGLIATVTGEVQQPLVNVPGILSYQGSLQHREASKWQRRATELAVINETVAHYADAALAQALLDFATSRLQRAEALGRIAQQRRAAGLGGAEQVWVADLSTHAARGRAAACKGQVALARAALSNVTGMTIAATQAPLHWLEQTCLIPEDAQALATTALSCHPEVQAARARIKGVDADLDASTWSWLPELQLIGSADAGSYAFLGPRWFVGASLTLAPPDAATWLSNRREHRADVAQANAHLQSTQQRVRNDVVGLYEATKATCEGRQHAEAAVAQALRYANFMAQSYATGLSEIDAEDVKRADDALADAHTALAQISYTWLRQHVSLQAAVGMQPTAGGLVR